MHVKALVLCAGRGTRLRPLTHTQAKASLPVAGRPVLLHILCYLRRLGFMDVGVVISPEQRELRSLRHAGTGQRITFIVQRHPHGIAHAVSAARRFLGDEPFLLYLGDNLTDEDITPALERFQRESPDGLITVREVPNPQQFGVAEVEGDRVVRVVEKPAVPRTNLAIAGIYLFSPALHEGIRTLKPSGRGEYEITDAIAALIRWNRKVTVHRITGWWQDMGTPEGILAANAVLLDRIQTDIDPTAQLREVQIQGRVRIAQGAVLEHVRLRGPLIIGAGSRLSHAYVGPYTSVGEGAVVEQASVENSILLPEARLQGMPFHLEDSLLGAGAVLEPRQGRAVSLHLGADTRVMIPHNRR